MQYRCRLLAPAREHEGQERMQQTWWTMKPKGTHGTAPRACAHVAAMSARFGAYGTVDLGINVTAVRPGASWEGETG